MSVETTISEQRAINILFLEDDPLGRWTYGRILEQIGCSVLKAGTCAEAREIWRSRDIDFVVTDYRLPDGNAVGLLSQMRAMGYKQPAVCLTAEPQAIPEGKRGDLGVRSVLTKPADPDAFRAEMTGLIAESRGALAGNINPDSSRVGRFRVVQCPTRFDALCAAGMEEKYFEHDWLALDMTGTSTVESDAVGVLISMADRRRRGSGRLCVVSPPGALHQSLVAHYVDVQVDIVESVEFLDSLGRRLNSICERSALAGCLIEQT